MGGRKELLKSTLGITEYPWSSDDELEAALGAEATSGRREVSEPRSTAPEVPGSSGLSQLFQQHLLQLNQRSEQTQQQLQQLLSPTTPQPQPQTQPQHHLQPQLHVQLQPQQQPQLHLQIQPQPQPQPFQYPILPQLAAANQQPRTPHYLQHALHQHERTNHITVQGQTRFHPTPRPDCVRIEREVSGYRPYTHTPPNRTYQQHHRRHGFAGSYLSRVDHVPARERTEQRSDLHRIMAFKRLTRDLGSLRHRAQMAGATPVTRVNPGVIVPSEANSSIRISRRIPNIRRYRAVTDRPVPHSNGSERNEVSGDAEPADRARGRRPPAGIRHRRRRTARSASRLRNGAARESRDPSPNVSFNDDDQRGWTHHPGMERIPPIVVENHFAPWRESGAMPPQMATLPEAMQQQDELNNNPAPSPEDPVILIDGNAEEPDESLEDEAGANDHQDDDTAEDDIGSIIDLDSNDIQVQLIDNGYGDDVAVDAVPEVQEPRSSTPVAGDGAGPSGAPFINVPSTSSGITASGPQRSPTQGVKRKRNDSNPENQEPNSIKEFNQNLLHLLECPVCLECMEPPMSQCRRGHLVCNRCRTRLTACPVCRTTFSSVRNRAMEGVAELLRYPCRHGCGNEVRLNRRTPHEASCSARKYQCPAPLCTDSEPLARTELAAHFQSSSSAENTSDNRGGSTLPPQDDGLTEQQPRAAARVLPRDIRAELLNTVNRLALQGDNLPQSDNNGQVAIPLDELPTRQRDLIMSILQWRHRRMSDFLDLRTFSHQFQEALRRDMESRRRREANAFEINDANRRNRENWPPFVFFGRLTPRENNGRPTMMDTEEDELLLEEDNESCHGSSLKLGPRHTFSLNVNSEHHENWLIQTMDEHFQLRIAVEIRSWDVNIYVSYIGPKCDAKNYIYEVTIDGLHNQRKLAYSRTTHSDLESASLNVSRQDCFHLTIDQALNFIRYKNRHCDSDMLLDVHVLITEAEPKANNESET